MDQVAAGSGIRPGGGHDAYLARPGRDAAQREAETAYAGMVQPLQVVEDERDWA
jgi:hypothetical protein